MSASPPRRELGGARLVFAVASALVFAVFLGVTLNERLPARHTLRAIVPTEVAPGRDFPVVARLFAHEGASLVEEIEEGSVEVEIVRDGEVGFRRALERGAGPHFGGRIPAPEREGPATLVLRRAGAEARAPIFVTRDPSPAPLRPLPSTLRVEIRRAEATSGAALRVGSGACVPEHACELLVIGRGVGEGARLEARGGLTLAEDARRGGHVAAFEAHVRGLAAEVRVELPYGGALEAGIPVASGGVSVRGPRRVLRPGDSLELIVESLVEGPHLVTHHVDGALVEIAAVERALVLERLLPGVHRVQVGGDLFVPDSLARAGAFVFVVGHEPASVLVARGAAELEGLELDDPFTSLLAPSPSDLEARALFSRNEGYRASPPPAVTGADRSWEGRGAQVTGARLAGAGAILLLGVWVAIVAVREGRRASGRAEAAAREAGDAVWVRPTRGASLTLGLALFVAYLAAAAALLSRFWIFG